MGSPLFDIRKSHLLITELLTNFGRKTEELNRLKTSIDIAWNEIRFGSMFLFWSWSIPYGQCLPTGKVGHSSLIWTIWSKNFYKPSNRKEKQFSGLGQLETSSTLAEISKKSVAICIIGQNYEGLFSKMDI